MAVQACVLRARRVQRVDAGGGPVAQLVERTELDGLRRTRLRTGGLHPVLDAVVTERALPYPSVFLALVDHAERAGGDAVPAPVADVLLHHHRAELRPHE